MPEKICDRCGRPKFNPMDRTRSPLEMCPSIEGIQAAICRQIETELALFESVKLQSHYASLLNQYDGGERLTFETVDAWLQRLRTVREINHALSHGEASDA